MADLTGALTLIERNLPDNDDGFITPAKLREVSQYLAVLANGASGGSAVYRNVEIDNSTDGPTYTVNGASQSYMVVRNGITLQSGYSFNTATGTWTFSDPLVVGELLTFIYQ